MTPVEIMFAGFNGEKCFQLYILDGRRGKLSAKGYGTVSY